MQQKDSLSNLSLAQLNEMNDKAQRLVELMKKGIVYFLFKKKSTGKPRKAHGTLRRDLIPPEAQRKRGRPKKRPEDLVIYYDTDKKAIRSFKDDLLQKVYTNTSNISKQKDSVNFSSDKESKQISNKKTDKQQRKIKKDNED